jgi:hypothetical protein
LAIESILPFLKPIYELISSKFSKTTYSPAIQKLRSQESVSFKEIEEAIGKDEKELYKENEVLHHLLRAFLRGEFENRKEKK